MTFSVRKAFSMDKGHFCTRNIVLPEKYTRVKQKSTVRRFVSYFLHIIYIYPYTGSDALFVFFVGVDGSFHGSAEASMEAM